MMLLGLLPAMFVLPDTSCAAGEDSCHVGTRLIRATRGQPNKVQRVAHDLPMTSFLDDVSDQLEQLPFSEFDTIDMAEGVVELKRKGTFKLTGSQREVHLIRVEPHELANGRVHASVEWQDPNGEGLVSTKMRMVNGENVVLGTDSNESSSTIVSVRIDCD